MSESSEHLESRIESIAAGVATEQGLEVHSVEVHAHPRQGRVRVVADRPGSRDPGTGVTIGELSRLSGELSRVLDLEDFIPFRYFLEVTSPGVERDLKRGRDFVRHVGFRARVVVGGDRPDGRRVVEGEIRSAGDDRFVMFADDGAEVEIAYEDVRRARTLHDFGRSESASPERDARRAAGKMR